MAFREVTMLEVKEVLRRWLAGDAKKEIARSVGVSRNTVRAYVNAGVRCGLVGQLAVTDEHGATYVLGSLGGTSPPHPVRIDREALVRRCYDCHDQTYQLTATLSCYFQSGRELRAGPYAGDKECVSCHLPAVERPLTRLDKAPVRTASTHPRKRVHVVYGGKSTRVASAEIAPAAFSSAVCSEVVLPELAAMVAQSACRLAGRALPSSVSSFLSLASSFASRSAVSGVVEPVTSSGKSNRALNTSANPRTPVQKSLVSMASILASTLS